MLIFSQKFSLFIQATDLKIDMSDSKIHLLWLEQFTRIILLKSTVYEIRIVMFSQASVILSTGGGEGDVRGRGACVVGACTTRGRAWQGACMAGGTCVAGETATEADGTHPTGMHSCYQCKR